MTAQLIEETRSHSAVDGKSVAWYRTPLERKVLMQLHERSDAKGLAQALGHLLVLAATGTLAFYSASHWPWLVTLGLTYAHGACYAFLINAVHEIGHGTVFRSTRLTAVFVHIYAFLGWINHEMFQASHSRHHRYTLHPPDDLEVVLPTKFRPFEFLGLALVNFPLLFSTIKNTVRIACGKFSGEWELRCFPPYQPDKRAPAIRWARWLLLGHALILFISFYLGWWMIPVLVTFAPFYAGLLQFLLNSLQHTGLQDNVADFRLCCRTVKINPLLGFLYWQMQYHTEHHMYAAVPFYNLPALHRAIRHELPPCPVGLIAAWREVRDILKRQAADPAYQHIAKLPSAG